MPSIHNVLPKSLIFYSPQEKLLKQKHEMSTHCNFDVIMHTDFSTLGNTGEIKKSDKSVWGFYEDLMIFASS